MARTRARILDRYLFRETLETWAGVTGVLLLILLASRFAFYLGDAAAGRLPGGAVFTLLGLSVVNYLTLIIPLGLFLAVMMAFGRLYRDSEMAALMACGVSVRDLYHHPCCIRVSWAISVSRVEHNLVREAYRNHSLCPRYDSATTEQKNC